MVAPALQIVARDLHAPGNAEAQLVLSAFVLAYAFAPMFLGPLSEIYGRIRVLQAANVWFLLWTIVCGFVKTEQEMIVARLFSGIGGSAIFAVSGAVEHIRY